MSQAQILHRVQNDTAPDEEFIVTRDGEVVPLTGATVELVIKSKTTDTITNTGHTECTVTDGPAGKAVYEFQDGDLPDVGDYECDLQITKNGKVETYYEIIKIRTRAEIAP
jgi:hypothetical protein